MDITDYVKPELIIIIPVLYVLGMMIKRSSISDRNIPMILGAMGIFLATAYELAAYIPKTASEIIAVVFAGITQGLLCASGSVYANNIIKQLKKNETDDKKDESTDKNNG